jgi:hypothetical protein
LVLLAHKAYFGGKQTSRADGGYKFTLNEAVDSVKLMVHVGAHAGGKMEELSDAIDMKVRKQTVFEDERGRTWSCVRCV